MLVSFFTLIVTCDGVSERGVAVGEGLAVWIFRDAASQTFVQMTMDRDNDRRGGGGGGGGGGMLVIFRWNCGLRLRPKRYERGGGGGGGGISERDGRSKGGVDGGVCDDC